VLVLEGYALLDLGELSLNPRVILVAVGVKSSECCKSLLVVAVIDEPLLYIKMLF
jgi:hypothetical protein